MEPIWKDYYVSLGTADGVLYRIRLDDAAGEIIYQGKAYQRPDTLTTEIRINDVCADYFSGVVLNLTQATLSSMSLPLTFYVEYYDEANETWTAADTVQFLDDWSYDRSYDAATMGLSFPINGRIDVRMWIPYTAVGASQVSMEIHYKDGTTATVIVPIAISADFSSDFNADFARHTTAAGSGTAVFNLTAWTDVDYVVIGNSRYQVVTDCGRYALYYKNAYGGYDAFLLEGICRRTDVLERGNVDVEYDNRNVQNRGVRNYINEYKQSWVLNTGLLSDDAGLMMHHLLNSTDVYLYDIDSGEMTPVVITDTETEYKTFKTAGRQPVQYAITVEVAQQFARR